MSILSTAYDIVSRPIKFAPGSPSLTFDKSLAMNIRHKYVRGSWSWAAQALTDICVKTLDIELCAWEGWCAILGEVFRFNEGDSVEFEHLLNSRWMCIRIFRRSKKHHNQYHITATITMQVENVDIDVLDKVCPRRLLNVEYINGKFEIVIQ